MSPPSDLSPVERLSVSRKAIVRHMNGHHPETQEHQDGRSMTGNSTVETFRNGKLAHVKHVIRMWWNRHPASAVVDLVSPIFNNYAKTHSFKLLGISALVGAMLVVARPWRMISISALLVAAFKSSGLSNTLLTMLSSLAHSSENADPTS